MRGNANFSTVVTAYNNALADISTSNLKEEPHNKEKTYARNALKTFFTVAMQHLAENTMTHRAGIELIRNELGMLRVAISGRV